MSDATFKDPDLTTFAGVDELGLVVVGPDRAQTCGETCGDTYWVTLEDRGTEQPENMTEQAERPLNLKGSLEVWISVAQSGPLMNRKHT